MRKYVVAAVCMFAMVAYSQQIEISATPTGGAVRAELDWQAIPGQTYSVHTTPKAAFYVSRSKT